MGDTRVVAPQAPGRLAGPPIAIVDIGSNSVRLVAYEGLSRALTPIFNEKVLCGLGRGLATDGMLAPEAMTKALAALRGFRLLCRQMAVADVTVLATAAAREARNGAAFLALAEEAIGAPITLLTGSREAELSALGVMSGVHRPDGVVGDLGGGSLELIDIWGRDVGAGVSLPIGGLVLSDLSRNSPKRAVRLVREALAEAAPLRELKGRSFYAVGGTFRALAKLHMSRRAYPLHVIQGYVMPAEAGLFADLLEPAEGPGNGAFTAVSAARRPLLAYGAVVLAEIVRLGQPDRVVVSTSGVREGMLFERLASAVRSHDPLLTAARDLNTLRARSPGHGEDLCRWTDVLVLSLQLAETTDQRRLRHAACLLADIAWRAHPDDRGMQAFATVANAAFVGLDHVDRCVLAQTLLFRHDGLDAEIGAVCRPLVGPALLERARILAGAMRIAFQLSAAMSDVLPDMPLEGRDGLLVLRVSAPKTELVSARVQNRLKQLAKLLGRDADTRFRD